MKPNDLKPSKRSSKSRLAFTLLEVVIAAALLAVIAVPAFGLAVMAVSKRENDRMADKAFELKQRLDYAMADAVDTDLVGMEWLASSDLRYVETDTRHGKNDLFFRVVVGEPAGYEFETEDLVRLFTYTISWPAHQDGLPVTPEHQRVFFSAVRLKP